MSRVSSPSLTMKYWIGLLCHCIGVLFCCLSLASVNWCHGTQSSIYVSVGLWRACLDGACIAMNDYDHMVADILGRGEYANWRVGCNLSSGKTCGVCHIIFLLLNYSLLLGWLTICQVCSATGVAVLCITLLLAAAFLVSLRCRQRLRSLQVLTAMITVGGEDKLYWCDPRPTHVCFCTMCLKQIL